MRAGSSVSVFDGARKYQIAVNEMKQATLFDSDTSKRLDISGSKKARSNGAMNKLSLEDREVHDWYRFVLSFPPHLVADYLHRFGLNGRHRVLDPFCGTGTTLVESKKHCIPSVGIEANPMACFASSVKLDWTIEPDDLLRHADSISRIVSKELASVERYSDPLLQCLNAENVKLKRLDS